MESILIRADRGESIDDWIVRRWSIPNQVSAPTSYPVALARTSGKQEKALLDSDLSGTYSLESVV
jgi:hypothetical protein